MPNGGTDQPLTAKSQNQNQNPSTNKTKWILKIGEKEVKAGDEIISGVGERAIVSTTIGQPPHKPSSTGKIHTSAGVYYPAVYGAKWHKITITSKPDIHRPKTKPTIDDGLEKAIIKAYGTQCKQDIAKITERITTVVAATLYAGNCGTNPLVKLNKLFESMDK